MTGHKLSRWEVKAIFNQHADQNLYWIVSGRAGCGKSRVLAALASKEIHPLNCARICEEHICTQLIFEATLAEELLKNPVRFLVEDKGRKVGSVFIPEAILKTWSQAPHFLIESPLEARVENIFAEHIASLSDPHEPQRDYLRQWRRSLSDSLLEKLDDLCRIATEHLDANLHREWIRLLLVEHLDPQFDYYFHLKHPPIEIIGTREEVTEHLREKTRRLLTFDSSVETAPDLGN